MSKASFLIEIEMPENAVWLKPQDQVAFTGQNILKQFFSRFIQSQTGDEVKVTLRPFDWLVPTPELEGTHSCILYFATQADLDEFEQVMHEAKPNMKVQQLT